jgi:hypothetical protein
MCGESAARPVALIRPTATRPHPDHPDHRVWRLYGSHLAVLPLLVPVGQRLVSSSPASRLRMSPWAWLACGCGGAGGTPGRGQEEAYAEGWRDALADLYVTLLKAEQGRCAREERRDDPAPPRPARAAEAAMIERQESGGAAISGLEDNVKPFRLLNTSPAHTWHPVYHTGDPLLDVETRRHLTMATTTAVTVAASHPLPIMSRIILSIATPGCGRRRL